MNMPQTASLKTKQTGYQIDTEMTGTIGMIGKTGMIGKNGTIGMKTSMKLSCGSNKAIPGTQRWSRYRSEEHTSELQSLMRISYAVFCLKKKNIRYEKRHSKHDRKKRITSLMTTTIKP